MTVEFDLTAPAVAPRDAATVILLRDGDTGLEIFFVKRRAEIRFMGGAYVFPGGKVDPADSDHRVRCDLGMDAAARRLGDDDGARALALHVAAIRECMEEAGVLLVRESVEPAAIEAMRTQSDVEHRPLFELLIERDLTLAASALVPLARWVTPRAETRRFDARFFMAAAPSLALASHDTRETVASEWLSPRQAIERARRQEIVLVPPTHRTVEILAQQHDVATALKMAPEIVPLLEPRVIAGESGGVLIVLPGDPLHDLGEPIQARSGFLDTAVLETRFLYDSGAWKPARADHKTP